MLNRWLYNLVSKYNTFTATVNQQINLCDQSWNKRPLSWRIKVVVRSSFKSALCIILRRRFEITRTINIGRQKVSYKRVFTICIRPGSHSNMSTCSRLSLTYMFFVCIPNKAIITLDNQSEGTIQARKQRHTFYSLFIEKSKINLWMDSFLLSSLR